jgi:GGDEF domain-containing protein
MSENITFRLFTDAALYLAKKQGRNRTEIYAKKSKSES